MVGLRVVGGPMVGCLFARLTLKFSPGYWGFDPPPNEYLPLLNRFLDGNHEPKAGHVSVFLFWFCLSCVSVAHFRCDETKTRTSFV